MSWRAQRSKKLLELVDRETRLANDRAKRALRYFTMIGDRNPAVRGLSISHDDVAATLVIEGKAHLFQRLHDFSTR